MMSLGGLFFPEGKMEGRGELGQRGGEGQRLGAGEGGGTPVMM